MAILKPYETPHKVTAEYHKIIKAEIDCAAQSVTVVLAIYATAEARASGGQVLWHEYQHIPFSALTQDPRDLLYPMLAIYRESFLRGGAPTEDGFAAPGNFTIMLTEEAMQAPAPAPEPEPEPAPAPATDTAYVPPSEPAPQ